MKRLICIRMAGRLMALGMFASGVSCTTTYDQSGRPVKTVDATAATVGIVAAGIIGYALANDDHDQDDYHDPYGYHPGNGYGHGYGNGYGRGRNRDCR